MRANKQTVLSALRLASENVPALCKDYQKQSIPLFIPQFKAPWCVFDVHAMRFLVSYSFLLMETSAVFVVQDDYP